MGLSVEERYPIVYDAIAAIMDERPDLDGDTFPNDALFARLRAEVDGLWHALLAPSSNTAHWLLGSASDDKVDSTKSNPWSVVVTANVQQMRPHRANEIDLDAEQDRVFDPFKHSLDIDPLIAETDTALAAAVRIYRHSETLIYALRRYHDDAFPEPLNRAASNIQGICYEIFRGNKTFTKAYLIHRMARMIYSPLYPVGAEDADFITRLVVHHALHHDMTSRMTRVGGVTDLIEQHRHLASCHEAAIERYGQSTPDLESRYGFDRLMAALWLAGRRFHYQHKHEHLLRALNTPEGRAALVEDEHDSKQSAIRDRLDLCRRLHQADRQKDERAIHKTRTRETDIHRG